MVEIKQSARAIRWLSVVVPLLAVPLASILVWIIGGPWLMFQLLSWPGEFTYVLLTWLGVTPTGGAAAQSFDAALVLGVERAMREYFLGSLLWAIFLSIVSAALVALRLRRSAGHTPRAAL